MIKNNEWYVDNICVEHVPITNKPIISSKIKLLIDEEHFKPGYTLDMARTIVNKLNGETCVGIKNVIFNDPATIVFWDDGTKTVVKTQNDESFDPEKGLVMAYFKKMHGNKGSYFNEIKKWTEKYDPVKVDFKGFACSNPFSFTLNNGKFSADLLSKLAGSATDFTITAQKMSDAPWQSD